MKIEDWNAIPKDEETNSLAIDGDLVTEIDGIAFLVQRKNDFNNVICIRIKPASKPITHTFFSFRAWCESNKLQYIRVEGVGKHTYKLLYKLASFTNAKVIKSNEESKEYNRHIYYIKTY